MPIPLSRKIETENRLRVFLNSEGLPPPDEVEYGFTCIRFLYHEAQACVVVDLDELAGDDDDPTRLD